MRASTLLQGHAKLLFRGGRKKHLAELCTDFMDYCRRLFGLLRTTFLHRILGEPKAQGKSCPEDGRKVIILFISYI